MLVYEVFDMIEYHKILLRCIKDISIKFNLIHIIQPNSNPKLKIKFIMQIN